MTQFSNQLYILDSFSHRDIKRWKKQYKEIEEYCWDHYSYFAHKRSLIYQNLKDSLQSNCKSFDFVNWCRVVDYRFADQPLSAKGSMIADPGGRFNIGDIDQSKFPRFPGLYLAENTLTALKEKCGVSPQSDFDGLTGQQLNLINNVCIVEVKGSLQNIFDLTSDNSLSDFYKEIKTIKLPIDFITRARSLKIDPMKPIDSVYQLRNTFLCDEWRLMPMQFDIPANSQIFGQIAHSATIEGILYPSVKTQKNCLVVYPQNLMDSSYIELNGDGPVVVAKKRIDKNTYHHFI